ncbi:MAG TPA: MoaD/ThiS family protein [Candidatus Acidoferrum sp.]|nr:MoaD/ThiS family protein [Candidatus Acidoferrum sp.]
MIRVILPQHLRDLARVDGEIVLEVPDSPTQGHLLDALEAAYPMLRGTVRDPVTMRRRPFIRFFAREDDLSHEDSDALLPDSVVNGSEPLRIVGAMAGG